MPWNRKDTVYSFIRELVSVRNNYIDGKTGYTPLWEMIHDGVFAFLRNDIKWRLKLIFNAGTDSVCCPVLPEESVLMMSEKENSDTISGKGYRITLERQ